MSSQSKTMSSDILSTTQRSRLEEAAAYSRFSFEAVKREEELKRHGYKELTAQKVAKLEYKSKIDRYREEKFGRVEVLMMTGWDRWDS